MPPWELQGGGACLLCCLPGGGTSLLSMAHPHASLQTHIKPPIQDSNHLVTTKMGHRHSVESGQPPTARQGRPLGRVPKPQAGAATLCSWQPCVELNLAAGTVSIGHLWQKCQFWPQLGDLGQVDFSKQLFLLAKAIKTQPGSEKLGDHASVSLWHWVLAHRASSPDAPGGPVAVVTGSGHWAKAVGRAVGTWVLQRRALWEEGDDHSILGGKTHIQARAGRSALLPRQQVLSAPAAGACCSPTSGRPVCDRVMSPSQGSPQWDRDPCAGPPGPSASSSRVSSGSPCNAGGT